MNNSISFSTSDGVKITVIFNNKTYEYSIDSPSIDVSDLIKDISNSNIISEIEIDVVNMDEYKSKNEVTADFEELYKFLLSIPRAYNKSVSDVISLD